MNNLPDTKEPEENETAVTTVPLSGLDCADCARSVEISLERIGGIYRACINSTFSSVEIKYDHLHHPDSLEKARDLINQMGYPALEPESLREFVIRVPEMDCSEEIGMIQKKLGPVAGIREIKFYPVNREMKISLDTDKTGIEKILTIVRDLGMTPTLAGSDRVFLRLSPARKSLILTIISVFFFAAALILLRSFNSKGVSTAFFLISIITGGFIFYRRAIIAAGNFNLDMNVLMTLAVIGAAFLGEWVEASMVVILFSLAQVLENYSLERTRNAIRGLMSLTPGKTLVRRENGEIEVPSTDVEKGEIIIVKPGGRIPLDGIVSAGFTSVNQAPVTGESMPVRKEPGGQVFAGTINQEGAVEIRVTHEYRDSTISRIVEMVEEAQARRAPAQNFVDGFARYYTPAVIFIAILIAIIPAVFMGQPSARWIYRSLVLLMIACPCALVISTPVTIVSGLTRAAREGILIKGGIHLENFAGIKAMALDKTGTVTAGKPGVLETVNLNHKSCRNFLSIAASVENRSEHMLARAVVERAREEGIPISEAVDFQAIPGMGATAKVDGEICFVGSHRFFEQKGLCSPEIHDTAVQKEAEGNTVVMVAEEKRPLGLIVLGDEPRKEAGSALKALKKLGIEKIIMLTGDNEATAAAMAGRLDMDYRAELLPGDKAGAIDQIKKDFGPTAMVGDGVNDAPALAAADVGIAMGAAGTDTALETADIALMSDELDKLPYALQLSRHTLTVIKQNIILALGIKLIFLVLGILGLATLWMAVFADTGASLIVIFNGMRLLGFRGGKSA